MECPSFKRKHLQHHYDAMLKRHYQIHGIDEVNLKYVFLQSFSKPLSQQVEVILKAQRIQLPNASLGNLYQAVISAFDCLCEQRIFFKHFNNLEIEKTYGRSNLIIRYSSHKTQKKFKRNKFFKARYFKRKKNRGKKKGDRCFICCQKGHFAKKISQKTTYQILANQYYQSNEDSSLSLKKKDQNPQWILLFLQDILDQQNSLGAYMQIGYVRLQ